MLKELQSEIDETIQSAIQVRITYENRLRARLAQLSAKHARSAPQRTIDLIHVAIALESGAENFLS